MFPATARGGHAVAIVGYKPDRFMTRNSWGDNAWVTRALGLRLIQLRPGGFHRGLRRHALTSRAGAID